MKKTLLRVITIMLAATLILSGFPQNLESAEAASDVSVSNVAVTGSGEMGSSATFSCDLSASVQIVDIVFGIQYGNFGSVMCAVDSIASSGRITCTQTIEYSGTWYVEYVRLQDVNGVYYYFYDNTQSADSYPANSFPINTSGSKVVVENKQNDTEAPKIDVSSFSPAQPTFTVGSNAIVYVNVSDNVNVKRIDFMVKMGSGPATTSSYCTHMGGDKWALNIPADYPGTYEIVFISARDESSNETLIYNSKYSAFEDYGYDKADLSAANFEVKSNDENDTKGPQVHVNTLTVSKNYAALNDKVTISVKVTDDSKIVEVTPFIGMGRGGICEFGGYMKYDSSSGKYSIELGSEYYGIWGVMGIYARDASGNVTCLYNSAYADGPMYGYFGEPTAKNDLNAATFYVGITDQDTGIFITGNGMDNNVSMSASDLDKKGSSYDKLYQNGYNVDRFCEIKVSGNYSEHGKKVKVEFPVKGKPDGSKVLIKHLRGNGKVQTTAATVRNGKVYMNVTDFSPFILLSRDDGTLLEDDIKKIETGAIAESDDEKSDSGTDIESDENKESKENSAKDNASGTDKTGTNTTAIIIIVCVLILLSAGGYFGYREWNKKKNEKE